MLASMKKAVMSNQQMVAGGLGAAIVSLTFYDFRKSQNKDNRISDLPP